MQGRAIAESGSTVNLRKKPSGDLMERIPVGSAVTVLEKQGEWWRVTTCGLTGWMKAEFIRLDDEQDDQGDSGDDDQPFDPDPEGEYVQVPREKLQRIYDEIGDLLGLRG